MSQVNRAAKKAITDNLCLLNDELSKNVVVFHDVVLGCQQLDIITSKFGQSLRSTTTPTPLTTKASDLVDDIHTSVSFNAVYLDAFLSVLVRQGCKEAAEKVAESAKKYGLKLPKYDEAKVQIQVTSRDDDDDDEDKVDYSEGVYKYPLSAVGKGKRGLALVINNVNFGDEKINRNSSIYDAVQLEETFGQRLNYEFIEERDLDSEAMKKTMSEVAKKINGRKNDDSFVCCILSHGNNEGILGVDMVAVPMKELVRPFSNEGMCRNLLGKPKIFFIQACRGSNASNPIALDDPVIMQSAPADESTTANRLFLPPEADFLYSYSTSPDNVAIRHKQHGSIYIYELCSAINNHSSDLYLYDILTIVHRNIARKPSYIKIRYHSQHYHQMPEVTSTLQGRFSFQEMKK